MENIQKRKQVSDLRSIRKRSEVLINSYSEEASRLGQLVDTLVSSDKDSESSVELEWDDSEERPPSFITERTLSDKTVDEIIDSIQHLDSPTVSQEDHLVPETPVFVESTRRNTSTDNQFLDEVATANLNKKFPNYNWPPKYPSQEPEDFCPFDSSSIIQDPV